MAAKPNNLFTKRFRYASSPAKMQGSALILVVFILVVIMLLGTTLIELLSTGNEAVAQEVLGTRALASANSAMQAQLQQLFPLNINSPTFTCPTLPAAPSTHSYDFSTIEGLYQCKATVSCSNYANYDGVAYYRLISTGECGNISALASNTNNIVVSSRTVQVEAHSL
jgi:MSHA biogenesis protein MshP